MSRLVFEIETDDADTRKKIAFLKYPLVLVATDQDVSIFNLPTPPMEAGEGKAYLYAYENGELLFLGSGNRERLLRIESVYYQAKSIEKQLST